MALLFNQFNSYSPEQQIHPENAVNSRHFYVDQIQSLKFAQKENPPSLFHITACSLNKIFDNLVYLLKFINKNFDIIAVNKTRTSKKNYLVSNVNLNKYFFESTPTESTTGGAMLYISNRLSYNPRIDLNMYKKSTRVYFYWNNEF